MLLSFLSPGEHHLVGNHSICIGNQQYDAGNSLNCPPQIPHTKVSRRCWFRHDQPLGGRATPKGSFLQSSHGSSGQSSGKGGRQDPHVLMWLRVREFGGKFRTVIFHLHSPARFHKPAGNCSKIPNHMEQGP